MVGRAVLTVVFQSAPPRGGRPDSENGLPFTVTFQSRPRVGGDFLELDGRAADWQVSIRAPAWGATFPSCRTCRTGRVSIRAPAWGATRLRCKWLRKRGVSIRAPAWGATMTPAAMPLGIACFNPRPRVGGDVARRPDEFGAVVSIRAPAWGATAASYSIVREGKIGWFARTLHRRTTRIVSPIHLRAKLVQVP